jgi:hypothetical protein
MRPDVPVGAGIQHAVAHLERQFADRDQVLVGLGREPIM